MPNVVHALYACSLALLFQHLIYEAYQNIKYDKDNIKPNFLEIDSLYSERIPGVPRIQNYSKINKASLDKNTVLNLYTVHDCFGVSADRVMDVIQGLKSAYIQLYVNSEYLREFHKYFLSIIEAQYGESSIYKHPDGSQ